MKASRTRDAHGLNSIAHGGNARSAADRASLHVMLLTANLISRSEPFQANAAFALLMTLVKAVDLPMTGVIGGAIQASMAAQSSGDPGHAMIARYALIHVTIALKSYLAVDKARSTASDGAP